jgi:RNA polymerase sigma-70 factor (sigma-E family)
MGKMSSAARSDGREADFTAYVHARQESLLRFAFLVTADPEAAKDLVQSALTKAYLRWDRISSLGAPDAYLRRIIVNEHTSWWRAAWRHREVTSTPLVEVSTHPSSEQSPRDAELWAHIVALSPMQRAIVVLRFYEDLTEAQTADVLGCSVGTVKTHSSRAMERLRTRLKEAPA